MSATTSNNKLKPGLTCLLVLSSSSCAELTGASGSVSGRSVREAVESLRSMDMHIVVATPNGLKGEFSAEDDDTHSWLREPANQQLFSAPLSIAELLQQQENALGYCGLVLPSSLGGVSDLAQDNALGNLVKQFLAMNKPICAIGYGVAGLCKAFTDGDKWCFSGWSLTAVPVPKERIGCQSSQGCPDQVDI